MRRPPQCAFSLVELLVVIAIVGLLLAMLVPAGSDAWQVALMTQCRSNLLHIWQAQHLWGTEHDSGQLAVGSGWKVALAPYVEDLESVFQCPCAPPRKGTLILSMDEIRLEMYRRSSDEFLGTAVIDGSKGVEVTKMGEDLWHIGIEDRWFMSGAEHGWHGGYDDIRFLVRCVAGVPVELTVLGGDKGIGMSYEVFRYDLYVNNDLVLRDFVSHENHTIPLGELAAACDYGMSKGVFEAEGEAVTVIDPKRFLILDYPQPVADYNQDGTEDEWDAFFILDPDYWMSRHGATLNEGETWRHYQSLRHFGRANVLFCDGHVEALAPSIDAAPEELAADRYLDETSPLWHPGGR